MSKTLTEFRAEVRRLVADLEFVSGCGCCGDPARKKEIEEELGKLLRVPMYGDKSGRDFSKFRTRENPR